MIKLAPSILSADFARLLEDVKKVEKAGCEYLHIDVMDGHFVPNITLGPGIVKSLRKDVNMVFDAHLMIENPDNYIKEFADAGCDIIVVHHEMNLDIDIEVDGGVKPSNIAEVVNAGANVIVAGSAIFNAGNIDEAVKSLRENASK